MKYRIFMLGIAFLSVICLSAMDYNMVVLKKDGSKVVIPTFEIEKVHFEEVGQDILEQIVVGCWRQDGDNDILEVKADGTGIGYENPNDYYNNCEGYRFEWNYKDGWVDVIINFYGETQIERMRVKSISQNKIVWKRYSSDANDDEWYDFDAFGYYEIWTWERL